MWTLLIGVVSGAIGSAVAALLIRDRAHHRTSYLALAVAIFCFLTALGRIYAVPELRVWDARREAAKFMREDPVFSAVVARHPEVAGQFSDILADLARRNAPQAESRAAGLAFGHSTVSQYLREFIATASDEALANFAAVMSDLIDELARSGGEACFSYLYQGRMPAGVAFSAENQQRSIDAMAQIVRSSSQPPPPRADPATVKAAMEALAARLKAEHGPDIAATIATAKQPNAPGVDHQALCEATGALYRTALKLPEEQRRMVIRTLLTGG